MFIFWEEELRVAGPGTMANTVTRLRAQFSAGRFSMSERLSGSMDGPRLRVWKASALGQAGDAVEFDGLLRPGGDGTLIEGTVRYRLATKVQFIGLLVIGLVLAAAGIFRELAGTAPGGELLVIGASVSAVTLLWIYSSHRMRHEQTQFIEARLNDVVAK